MRRFLKILVVVVGASVVIITVALAYLNYAYLPQKVKTEGAAFLKKKSKGRISARSVEYMPFRGVKLENIALLSKAQQPIFTIDKLYCSIHLWPLLSRRELDFRLDLYPHNIQRPFIFRGIYQIKKKHLQTDFTLKTDWFIPAQPIMGKIEAALDREGKSDIDITLSSERLNLLGNLSIKDEDLYIQRLSAEVLGSAFDFIGDIQNLSEPFLNIYGNLKLDLAGLKGVNPKYYKLADKIHAEGDCSGEIFIAAQAANPQIGLKIHSPQIMIEGTEITDLSMLLKVQDKKALLSKCYAKLSEGEINLQADAKLDLPDFPATLNLNVFNLELNKIIKELTGKDSPVHGRLFSLGRLNVPLKDLKAVEGKLWAGASGANMLELALFREIADILHLPQLRNLRFKEAAGNFSVAKGALRTEDFRLVSDTIEITFKGYVDFNGELAFDILPSFPQGFLATAPNIGNILGVLSDSTGNFLGEIKLKGNIKQPRYTFKPISPQKLLPRGLEEGLKQLFKFK